MTIEAKVIADSVNPHGNRLTSFVCTYPRLILAEVNTHRALSRNSGSSRAVPVARMMERVRENPAEPVYWGKNQKGMQAGEELPPEKREDALGLWMDGRDHALWLADHLTRLGVHKQIANRVLEPYAHITTLISATEWGNFFNLRAHPDAQPEFQELAYAMLEAMVASTPTPRNWGEWHLPFGDRDLDSRLTTQDRVKICTARAARVSYQNFEGAIDHAKDFELHDDLLASGHMSPFEHAAFATPRADGTLRSNFRGWVQYRKLVPNENREAFDPAAILARRPRRG